MNYNELVKSHSDELIEKLVKYVLTKDPVEILFDFLKEDQWAIISMHQYEEDIQVSVRLHLNNYYDLYLGYYDDEDEFFEIIQPLTDTEIEMLPPKLKIIMKKVLDDEKGVRLSGHFLAK